MPMKKQRLQTKIARLEGDLRRLKADLNALSSEPETVKVPDEVSGLFGEVEAKIRAYFNDIVMDPGSGEITVQGQRYVLLRSDSLSYEFLEFVKERYSDRPAYEAISIGNNFLYDNAKVIGKRDALAFHERLGLKDPIGKLAAGPIHFAFTGWANVEILESSNPVPNDSFILKFQHHNSFEAKSWLKAGKKSNIPVCTMNCGYSAGWCEESFGLPLTTVEISCEAKGDEACMFVMAPTDKVERYVGEMIDLSAVQNFEIPVFFKRKNIEEKLRESLGQKETLIKEIHHRVKNNLQVISSLLRLQMDSLADDKLKEEFVSSINRVNTMAVVHELMYQRKDFDSVSMRSYIDELTKSLVQLYALNNNTEVDIDVNIEDVNFNLEQSIPLALILNEITCNSFKHALQKGGKFYLHLSQKGNTFYLIVGDNGPGFKKPLNEKGLGLALIEILCDQLDATREVDNSENGLEYRITFDLEE